MFNSIVKDILATNITPLFHEDDNEDLPSTCEWGVKHIWVARELLYVLKSAHTIACQLSMPSWKGQVLSTRRLHTSDLELQITAQFDSDEVNAWLLSL